MEILISIGFALGMIGFFLLGVAITLQVGKHFVDNYVEKLTPDKLKQIEETVPEEHKFKPSEEFLRAMGLTEDEVEAFYNSHDYKGVE
jgi:hypothetical protein